MRLHRFPLLLLLVAVGSWSCRGCGDTGGPEAILDLAPEDAAFALLVPELGALVEGTAGFATAATRKAGASTVQRARESLKLQLGFDVFDPASFEALGLHRRAGLLVFSHTAQSEPLLALAVKDRSVLESRLKELIQKTDGATHFSETTVSGFTVVTAGRPFGDEVVPSVLWAWVGDFLLAARAGGKASLDAALGRLAARDTVPRASLRTDPVYRALSRRVDQGKLTVFARGSAASELLPESAGLGKGMVTSLEVGAGGLATDTFVQLDLPGLEGAFSGQPPMEAAGRISDDALVALVTPAARPEALQALKAHPALALLMEHAMAELGRIVGVDAEREILPLLEGGLTVSLRARDLAELPARLKQQRSPERLLDLFPTAVTAKLKDSAAFVAVLERSQAKLGERGVAVRRRDITVNGKAASVFEPERAGSGLGWAVIGDTYAYAAGPGELDRVLHLVAGDEAGLAQALEGSVAAEAARQPGMTLLVVRLGKIADAAATIAIAGQGQQLGLAALAGSLFEVLRTLSDVAVIVSAETDGLRLRTRERLQ